jgi:hypothetical protein
VALLDTTWIREKMDMSFEKRFRRAIAERRIANRDGKDSSLVVNVLADLVDRAMGDCRPDGDEPFLAEYKHRSVGICLRCGPFNCEGEHVCRPVEEQKHTRKGEAIPEAVCLWCHHPVKDHALGTFGIVCPEPKLGELLMPMHEEPKCFVCGLPASKCVARLAR